MDTITMGAEEGSFEAKWEDFVEENLLSEEVADKLKSVFFAGAAAVFEELESAAPKKNTAAAVHTASTAFKALEGEVLGFFEDNTDIDDLTLLVVASPDEGSTGGIAKHE